MILQAKVVLLAPSLIVLAAHSKLITQSSAIAVIRIMIIQLEDILQDSLVTIQ